MRVKKIFFHGSVFTNSSQKVFHRLLLYISRGSNTNVCTTYDCRERDLVANVWVDQTYERDCRFFHSHCCPLEEKLGGNA